MQSSTEHEHGTGTNGSPVATHSQDSGEGALTSTLSRNGQVPTKGEAKICILIEGLRPPEHTGFAIERSSRPIPATDQSSGSASSNASSGGEGSPHFGIVITPMTTLSHDRRRLLAPATRHGDRAGTSAPHFKESRARTKRTEQEYEYRVRSLYKQSTKERTIDPQQPVVVSPMEMVQDLVQRAVNLAPGTWCLYRAALLWHLAANRDRYQIYEDAYQLLASTLRPPTGIPVTSAKPGNACGRRYATKRTIPEKDLVKLLNTLCAMNRTVNWGARVQYWLMAGLASGARPCEWERASWLDDAKLVLCLPNAKRKRAAPTWDLVGEGKTIHDIERDQPDLIRPGEEHDPSTAVRNVPIDFANTLGRLLIDLHLKSLQSYMAEHANNANAFRTYYNNCRQVLWKACKRAFKGKKFYSLYVMRSQFAANKKAEYDLQTVAELMGHSSTRVTMSSYGPRRAAHTHTHTHTHGVVSESQVSSAATPATNRQRSWAGRPRP